MATATDEQTRDERLVSLVGSLDEPWLKILLPAARESGQASLTLAGLLKMTQRETFSSAELIASNARLPVKTVRKHLQKLHDHGWIRNRGREHTKTGRPRRTCTIEITKQTRAAMDDYAPLPWFFTDDKRLPWSSQIVLSVILSRLMSLKSVCQNDYDDEIDLVCDIENLGYDKFTYSLKKLEELTGLSRHSVISAKVNLSRLGLAREECQWRDDGGNDRSLIEPNWEFQVGVESIANGRCHIRFYPRVQNRAIGGAI